MFELQLVWSYMFCYFTFNIGFLICSVLNPNMPVSLILLGGWVTDCISDQLTQ